MSEKRRQEFVYPPGPEARREEGKEGHQPEVGGLPISERLFHRFCLVRHDEEAILRVLRQVPRIDRLHARTALFQALGGQYTNAGPRALTLCERVFGSGTMYFPSEWEMAEQKDRYSPDTLAPSQRVDRESKPEPTQAPGAIFEQGRIQTLCELLKRLVSQVPFPSESEILTLLDAAESHVAKAALSRLNSTLLPGGDRYGKTYYQALKQAAGEKVSDHLTGRRDMIERMLPGWHKAGQPKNPPPLPLETRLLQHARRFGAGSLLGSWDRSVTPEAKAQRHAEAEERLGEDHPILAVLGQGGGEPLPEAVLRQMNRLFGHDFSHVRIHTDAAAVEVAELLGARALAFGAHVYFCAGQYAPGTMAGDRLLVHELFHVVQFDEGRLPMACGAGLEVSQPDDVAEREADSWAQNLESAGNILYTQIYKAESDHSRGDVDTVGVDPPREVGEKAVYPPRKQGNSPLSLAAAPATGSAVVLRAPDDNFPWKGRINTWSVPLRRNPTKNLSQPHVGTDVDLLQGTEVLVLGRQRGWLKVRVKLADKSHSGYVSQELVTYVQPATSTNDLLLAGHQLPSLDEALITLKAAETARKKQGRAYRPSVIDQQKITLATTVIQKTGKYEVNSNTYTVAFHERPGTKLKVTTIEDFILFVEEIERQYPTANPKEIASEIRQIWFSDPNWDIISAGRGLESNGTLVDIESEPNPIATKFDMRDLSPTTKELSAGKKNKRLATAMGTVDISHVIAGLDAWFNGFPQAYPKSHLKAHGNDDSDAQLKYEVLRSASGGDSRDFTTWAGDIGQAYADFLASRYLKKEKSRLADFIASKFDEEAMLGDIHGYIAVNVWKSLPAQAGKSTGAEIKVSNILRAMYLVGVDQSKKGENYQKYFEEASGKKATELRNFIYSRSLAFARIWFARHAVNNNSLVYNIWRGVMDGKRRIAIDAMAEFDAVHKKHMMTGDPSDKIDVIVDKLLKTLSSQPK